MFFDVREYGATGDGQTLDTESIKKAVDACAAAGGGVVYFPGGRYLTGTIALASNITLHISTGATILGSPDLSDYIKTGPEPKGDNSVYHLIQAEDAERVTVTGGGVIDGQGAAYWYETTDRYGAAYSLPNSAPKRPSPMIDFKRCTDVRVENVSIVNAAGWNLHLDQCQRVWIRGVTITNPMTGPNTDGIDINGCRDLFISDCHVETGDDAICLKTDARSSTPCEHITITNCVLASRTCAIKFGTGSHADFRQITVSNCAVYRSEKAFGIYCFDGGTVEDVLVSNMVVETAPTPPNYGDRPIHIDVRRRTDESKLGRVRNITFANWIIRSPGRIIVSAVEPVERLRFTGMQHFVTGVQDLESLADPSPSPMQFAYALPHTRTIPAYYVISGVKSLAIDDVTITSDVELSPMDAIWLENVDQSQIDDVVCDVPVKEIVAKA
jgi:polygalacturonase